MKFAFLAFSEIHPPNILRHQDRGSPSSLPSLVEPYPAPRLHRGRLHRGVRVLQAVPQGPVLRSREPVVRFTLQGGQLRGQVGELSGEVLGGVPLVAGPGVSHRTSCRRGQPAPLPSSARRSPASPAQALPSSRARACRSVRCSSSPPRTR